jgi:uncharacterized protein (TIGR03032 family)
MTDTAGEASRAAAAMHADSGPVTQRRDVGMQGSPGLADWLAQQQIGLAFTTYQTNRLFLVGRKADGTLAVNERLFDKPMGLFAQGDELVMACRYQIWRLENRLAPGETHRDGDRLYVPSQSHTTGDLNVHDVVFDKNGRLLFVNTDFSCLATLRPGFSFEPVWQPPFISRLAAEDRCHLNGLALQDGEATWATACSATDKPASWRDQRTEGGVVLHIPSNEVAATGLSMPHSPRWHEDRLWLLNAGTGEFGFLDGPRFQAVAFCPGFLRGLAFVGRHAIVGLSKLRSKSFAGLGLETRLDGLGLGSQCGLMVIDLGTGQVLHGLQIGGVVGELFDVVVLPGVRRPRALGFQDDDIDRLVNFPGSTGLLVTKPTVQRPGLGKPAPKAGLPRAAQSPTGAPPDSASGPPTDNGVVRYQQVFHLNPDNLLAYESMTSPSLQQRWLTQPQRGELLGISASVDGDMVGFAVAELHTPDGSKPVAELLSISVVSHCQDDRVLPTLLRHLENLAGQALVRQPS